MREEELHCCELIIIIIIITTIIIPNSVDLVRETNIPTERLSKCGDGRITGDNAND
jgi:hypothetical protein